MQTTKNQILTALLIILCQNGHAQGFFNLNFEAANLSSYGAGPAVVPAINALPGWTVSGSYLGTNVLYNNLSLGAPSVSIFGTNGFYSVIDGTFSVDLYGGSGSPSGVSISQTGMVPAGTTSLLFKAQPVIGTLSVSLGGQNISFSPISTGSNYTLYGGNIPTIFAGQNEQLVFLALPGVNNYWEIDDIQFSPSAVPEPSSLALGALQALLVGFRRWRNFAR